MGGTYSSRKTSDGMNPCEECPQGTLNYFLGSNDCHTADQQKILSTLYDVTNGPSWTNIDNWRDDNKTFCEFDGITCANNHNVIEINLSNKNLSGTIPDDLIYLPHLRVLDLSDNELEGN